MSLIGFIREAIDYMYPKRKFRPVPKQIINVYKIGNETNEQERLIMLTGHARSPQAAKELMKKHNARTAHELLKKLPKKRNRSFRQRFKLMLMKLDGHQTGDPYHCGRKDDVRL